MKDVSVLLNEIKPECEFEKSNNFIEDGLLDSFDIIELISKIEHEYGIIIDGLDVVPENFSTISQIEELIYKSGKGVNQS